MQPAVIHSYILHITYRTTRLRFQDMHEQDYFIYTVVNEQDCVTKTISGFAFIIRTYTAEKIYTTIDTCIDTPLLQQHSIHIDNA